MHAAPSASVKTGTAPCARQHQQEGQIDAAIRSACDHHPPSSIAKTLGPSHAWIDSTIAAAESLDRCIARTVASSGIRKSSSQ